MSWLFKVGVSMAAVAAIITFSVTLMIIFGPSNPKRVDIPAELRAVEPTPYRLAEPRVAGETAPAERAELQVLEETVTPDVVVARPPQPERRERRSEAPRRPPDPPSSPEPDLPRETTPNGPSVLPEELAAASEPRRYEPRQNAAFTLTVEALGVYDVPVANAAGDAALNRGAIHLPDTDMPWDEGKHKNVYVAGHRLGYPGTDSRLLFYQLDRMRPGDGVVLKGRGRVFKYRVSEKLVVDPSDRWAKAPVSGRDMVSLQTCTPIPTFEKRLVIRADRV